MEAWQQLEGVLLGGVFLPGLCGVTGTCTGSGPSPVEVGYARPAPQPGGHGTARGLRNPGPAPGSGSGNPGLQFILQPFVTRLEAV